MSQLVPAGSPQGVKDPSTGQACKPQQRLCVQKGREYDRGGRGQAEQGNCLLIPVLKILEFFICLAKNV